MATTNQQLVYAMATPPHGIVQYEYYTHQMPQSASTYATSIPMQYSGSVPPPPPGATVVAVEQNGDGVGKHSADEASDDSVGYSGEYPQRPGEKMCAYYMTTRLCSFGNSCRFDHPAWVPIGGIPNWKEATVVGTPIDPATLPQRPTEPDCAYFMKTGECKYGTKCRFNHPIDKLETKTIEEQSSDVANAGMTIQQASAYNSRGLPLRPGEGNCVFYGKTGSCKYGIACRYNHPEILLTAGGRTGATLQPQQAVYVQSQQQPNVQYQMVQATQDYTYPTTTAYQSTTPTYTTATSAYPGQQVIEYVYPTGTTMQVQYPAGAATPAYLQGATATGQSFLPGTPTPAAYSQTQVTYPPGTPTTAQAYPQGTIVQQYPPGTNAGQVFPQAQSYPLGATFQQGGTTLQTYPPGTTTTTQTQQQQQQQQQTCPPGTTTSYPPGTPSGQQSYPPGTTTTQAYPGSSTAQAQPPNPGVVNGVQTFPPGTFPPGTTGPQATATAVEYGYPVQGQQPQEQQQYVYATQQPSQNGTEQYVYATEQQAAVDQYGNGYTAVDAAGQPTTADYGYTAAAHNAAQEYAYAAAAAAQAAYHQGAVYAAPVSGLPHPQRPGEPDCTFYIKTGECSFGATCKFHHPPDRIPTGIPKPSKNQTGVVKLSLAGLPRREGEAPCTYYMKTGACKFGLTCKYDHPPPQEIIARAVEAVREGISTTQYEVNIPTSVAESQETTPLPPGTDVPPNTAAAM